MRVTKILAGWPLAAALAVAAAAPAAPALAQDDSAPAHPVFQIATGRGRLITLPAPMTDVFIANPGVADASVRSPTQVYIFGKAPGETTVSITNKAGRVLYAATIRVGNNYDSIGAMLAVTMPEAHVVATTMNGVVLLTGTVATPDDAAEAERLVQAFVGKSTQVLSHIRTSTPLQVNLQVRVAEVSRTFVKNIGSNLITRDTTGGFQFGIASGRSPGTIGSVDTSSLPLLDASSKYGLPAGSLTLPFDPKTGNFVIPNTGSAYTFTKGAQNGTINAAGKLFGLDILSALDLGETDGQVTTLANPNVTALSGETASFLAGGEIPIPVSQGLGATSVEYKQYGVSLSYTPTVLSDGRISLRVRPEVSELSSAGAVSIGGVTIPALTTRRVETTVELGSGQSFVIGGLLQNHHQNSITKTPGVGDLPVLGALFRSNNWQRDETELVIVITPYLVKPVNANQIVLPTDGYKAPTDLGRVFMGQLGGGTSGGSRPMPTMAAPAGAQPVIGAVTAPSPATPAPAPAAPAANSKHDRKKAKGGDAAAAPGFGF